MLLRLHTLAGTELLSVDSRVAFGMAAQQHSGYQNLPELRRQKTSRDAIPSGPIPHPAAARSAGLRCRWVFFGFVLVAGFFFFTEHRAHLMGALPFVAAALCPLMHLFHGGLTDATAARVGIRAARSECATAVRPTTQGERQSAPAPSALTPTGRPSP